MIGIIGTGWLGSELKLKLEKKKISCFGTRASIYDEQKNIFKYRLGSPIPILIKESDTLVITIPPRLRRKSEKEQKEIYKLHENFLNQIPDNTYVIYTSSTSVYNGYGLKTEKSQCEGNLFEIEQLLRIRFKNHLILRLGGLAGPDRMIVDILSKKGILNGYNLPTNLLHLEDASNAILRLLKEKRIGTYNICSPEHPTKWEVYNNWLVKKGMQKLKKGASKDKFKTISCKKIIDEIEFQFKYNSPIDFDF